MLASNVGAILQNSARILLVDDEDLLSWCIELELTALGFQVKTASSLKLACDILESFEPDLIICDQGLPDGWGTEFIKTLRRQVPVIMITAFTPPRLEDLNAVGINKLLRKPFDLHVLTGEVQNHLMPLTVPASGTIPPPSAAAEA